LSPSVTLICPLPWMETAGVIIVLLRASVPRKRDLFARILSLVKVFTGSGTGLVQVVKGFGVRTSSARVMKLHPTVARPLNAKQPTDVRARRSVMSILTAVLRSKSSTVKMPSPARYLALVMKRILVADKSCQAVSLAIPVINDLELAVQSKRNGGTG